MGKEVGDVAAVASGGGASAEPGREILARNTCGGIIICCETLRDCVVTTVVAPVVFFQAVEQPRPPRGKTTRKVRAPATLHLEYICLPAMPPPRQCPMVPCTAHPHWSQATNYREHPDEGRVFF